MYKYIQFKEKYKNNLKENIAIINGWEILARKCKVFFKNTKIPEQESIKFTGLIADDNTGGEKGLMKLKTGQKKLLR